MGKVPAPTRAEHVKLLIPLLEQHKDDIAHLYVKEQGKTIVQAKGEIDKSIEFIDYMASLSMSNKGEVLQNSIVNETIQLTKPIGVTAGIVPWNAPILVLMRKVIPAIVTGCSVVIKPSEETTLLTLKSLNFSVIQLFQLVLFKSFQVLAKQLEHNWQLIKIFNLFH